MGIGFGLIIAAVKFAFILPLDIADALYGAFLLVTLVITLADLLGIWESSDQSKVVNFVLGLLYPLDAYAVMILFGLPLPD